MRYHRPVQLARRLAVIITLAAVFAAAGAGSPGTIGAGGTGKVEVLFERGGDAWVARIDGTNARMLVEDAGQPRLSPDRRKLAFVRTVPGMGLDIFVANADGSAAVNVTNNPASDRDPSWAPGSDMLAFASSRAAHDEVYIMNADGSAVDNLTGTLGNDTQPSWGPNDVIAFTTNRTGNLEVFSMNRDGSDQTNLTNDPADDSHGDWNSNGTRIVFQTDRAGNDNIYRMDDDGANLLQLTSDPAADRSPSIRTQSTFLLFVSNRTGNFEIWSVRQDGTEEMQRSSTPADEAGPTWLVHTSGAADCSSPVDPIDAAFVLQATAGLIPGVPCPISADVNQDGAVTAVDAALILQFAAGLIALPL